MLELSLFFDLKKSSCYVVKLNTFPCLENIVDFENTVETFSFLKIVKGIVTNKVVLSGGSFRII